MNIKQQGSATARMGQCLRRQAYLHYHRWKNAPSVLICCIVHMKWSDNLSQYQCGWSCGGRVIKTRILMWLILHSYESCSEGEGGANGRYFIEMMRKCISAQADAAAVAEWLIWYGDILIVRTGEVIPLKFESCAQRFAMLL